MADAEGLAGSPPKRSKESPMALCRLRATSSILGVGSLDVEALDASGAGVALTEALEASSALDLAVGAPPKMSMEQSPPGWARTREVDRVTK